MIEKPPSSLEFDPIYIDDNNSNLYTTSYHTLPGRRPSFAPVVEQLLAFMQAFIQTTMSRALPPLSNKESQNK